MPRLQLSTERLVLDPVSHVHDDDLLAATLASREQLLPWMPWAKDLSMSTQRAYADRAIRAWDEQRDFHYAITGDSVGIGVIGVDAHGPGAVELHYWLRTDMTGHGYVTEAARCLLGWARDVILVQRVVLNAGMNNTRSLAVASRLGFTRDGELAGGMEGADGVFAAYTHHLDV